MKIAIFNQLFEFRYLRSAFSCLEVSFRLWHSMGVSVVKVNWPVAESTVAVTSTRPKSEDYNYYSILGKRILLCEK